MVQPPGEIPLSLSSFESLVDLLPDAVALVAEDGRVVAVNHHLERLFAAPRSDMVGKSVEMLVPKGSREAHKTERALYWDRPETRPMGEARELWGERGDGERFPVEISLSPVTLHEGKFVAAAVRDLSTARRAWADLHEAHVTLSAQLSELERRNRGLLGINRLSETLQAVLSEPEIHQIVAENGPRMFPRLSGRLWLRETGPDLALGASWGDASAAGTLARPEDCWAIRLGRVCGPVIPTTPRAARTWLARSITFVYRSSPWTSPSACCT